MTRRAGERKLSDEQVTEAAGLDTAGSALTARRYDRNPDTVRRALGSGRRVNQVKAKPGALTAGTCLASGFDSGRSPTRSRRRLRSAWWATSPVDNGPPADTQFHASHWTLEPRAQSGKIFDSVKVRPHSQSLLLSQTAAAIANAVTAEPRPV